MKSLRKLLPESMHTLTRNDSPRYVPPTECKLLSILPEVAVPQPCSTIFRIDFIENGEAVSVKWTGEMPTKCKIIVLFKLNRKIMEFFYCRSRPVDKSY